MRRSSFCWAELLIFFFWLFIQPMSLHAQSGNSGGRSGAQFLEIGVGARAVAMGGSYVAIANDISACYYNPSGLVSLKNFEAIFSVVEMPADINYNFAAIALPVRFLQGTIGFQAGQLSTGDMTIRTPMQPQGTGQKFDAANSFLGISYARSISNKFSIGMSIKYLQLDMYKYSASGVAMDIGTMYYTGFKSFRFGWIVSNFGQDLKFINETFSLPTAINFGVAAEAFQNELNTLTLSIEANRPNDNDERLSVGMEYWFKDLIAFRVGYRINYDSDRVSFGLGFRAPIPKIGYIKFDYSYSDMNYLDQMNRYSIIFEL